MRQKLLLALLAVVIIGALTFKYGRSLWYPIYVKATGGQTVGSVVKSIKAQTGFEFGDYAQLQILGFKEEQILEVWGIDPQGTREQLAAFPFTGFSGQLGPKLREGDGQIPEGIYTIEYLNPNSSYHLSMKLNYPNAFDQAKGKLDGRYRLGYDIFIHGKSATIGCIPIGDTAIEQLFLMVAEVGMGNVQVIIAPYDMRTTTKAIEIDGIDWEAELYMLIKKALTSAESFTTE